MRTWWKGWCRQSHVGGCFNIELDKTPIDTILTQTKVENGLEKK